MATDVLDMTMRQLIEEADDNQCQHAALVLMLRRPESANVDYFVDLLDDEWREAIRHGIDRYRHS